MTSTHPGMPQPGPGSDHDRYEGGSPWRIRSVRPPWLEPRQAGAWEVKNADRCRDHDREAAERPPNGTAPGAGGEARRRAVVPPVVGGFVKALAGTDEATSLEHGDREQFLAPQWRSLSAVVRPHWAPAQGSNGASDLPRPRLVTDPTDDDGHASPDALAQMFAQSVERAGGHCHRVEGGIGDVPDTLLDRLVAEHEAWEVVVTGEPEAKTLSRRFSQRGSEVRPATRQAAGKAAIGITSARAGIAATGSLVLDSSSAGGRIAGVLPPVHICLLPTDRLVATPSDVLRPLGDQPSALPPSLVLVAGPARPGNVDQLLTVGAHGPRELHVILL